MKTVQTFDAQKIAREVHSYLQDAVGDMASDMLSQGSGFLDDKWDKRIKKAKKGGVRDILGWLADELYNDPDTLQDLMGDKIFEGVSQSYTEKKEWETAYNSVLDVLSERTHPGMKKACKRLRYK